MAQLSRPYQIALGAIAVLGLLWVLVLHSHSHSPNPSEPAPSSPSTSHSAPTTASTPASPGSPSSVYHGSAPGVEGLTRAVAKAHEAVKTSETNAQQLQRKSSEASGEAKTSPTTGGTKVHRAESKVHTTPTQVHHSSGSTQTHKASGSHHPQQATVEHELKQGKTVMLLFWNPQSIVDEEVHSQAKALASHSKQAVALHTAHANQVGMFGHITEVAHVYQTPTILIVNEHGVVSSLTGLTDVFSLEQAVREARKASA